MTASFGQSALQLYALAARLLGWRPAEFWAATPAELAAAFAPQDVPAGLDRDTLKQLLENEHA